MFFDFGGGFPCAQCGEMFEWVPLDTAQQLGGVPAGFDLSPAVDVPRAKWKALEPFWTGIQWPKKCVQCEPSGWVVPVAPAGSSFFRA